MAGVKSDQDESEDPVHPLSKSRPGVYVQVVAPRRRKGDARPSVDRLDSVQVERLEVRAPVQRVEARPVVVDEQEQAEAITVPGETLESATVRESGTYEPRSLDESGTRTRSYRPSESSNDRPDLVVVNLPGPPRMPTISLSGAPLPVHQSSATLLDAPASLRPEPHAEGKARPSWGLLLGVAALSAVIASALIVAVRSPAEPIPTSHRQAPQAVEVQASSAPASKPAAPTREQPAAVPAGTAVAQPPARAAAAGSAPPKQSVKPSVAAALLSPSLVAAKSGTPDRSSRPALPPSDKQAAHVEVPPPLQPPPVAEADSEQATFTTANDERLPEPVLGTQRELPENPYLQQ